MRWFQFMCALAVLTLTLGCNAGVKELAPDTTETGDSGPSMEEMMGDMPEDQKAAYEKMQKGDFQPPTQ